MISLIDISPYKFDHPGGEGKPDWVHVVSTDSHSLLLYLVFQPCIDVMFNLLQAPVPDVYAGKYRNDKHTSEELLELYTNDVKKLVDESASRGAGVSCFIAESLQSCGGQIILPPNYLRTVYK